MSENTMAWIPVTEGLPETSEDVWITVRLENDDGDIKNVVCKGSYFKKIDIWGYVIHYSPDEWERTVVAWMPYFTPEPYAI